MDGGGRDHMTGAEAAVATARARGARRVLGPPRPSTSPRRGRTMTSPRTLARDERRAAPMADGRRTMGAVLGVRSRRTGIRSSRPPSRARRSAMAGRRGWS